jgi:hypothetical protein
VEWNEIKKLVKLLDDPGVASLDAMLSMNINQIICHHFGIDPESTASVDLRVSAIFYTQQ